jgi:hypothetical protein
LVRVEGVVVPLHKALKALGLNPPANSAALSPSEVVAKAYINRQWWQKQQTGEQVDWSRVTPKLLTAVAARLKVENT